MTLVAWCREWVELVASDRIAEAIALLWVPPEYDPSQRWTPESLGTYVANYGSWDPLPDGRVMKMTSMSSADSRLGATNLTGRVDVIHHDRDPRSGWIDLNVPLNGTWSDLTAQFEFRPIANGTAISLYDLHVL
jgi:hypothetical protein